MKRVDQKYIASAAILPHLLAAVAGDYYVQQIEGNPIAPYHTLYFDTCDLAMYTMHHNRKLNRQKLRVRCYRSTQTTFFEIKNKDNKRKTSKVRIPIDSAQFDTCLALPEVSAFVNANTPYGIAHEVAGRQRVAADLQSANRNLLFPCLENFFCRITLVDKAMHERVTIDQGISFHNRATGRDADIGHILVIEVKHEQGAPQSDMEQALHALHVLPRRMSKYCIGTALTNQAAKSNRFKPKLLYIDRCRSISMP